MLQIFQCPSCGAQQDYEERTKAVIQCAYCGQSIIVPKELRKEVVPPPIAYTDLLTAKQELADTSRRYPSPKPSRPTRYRRRAFVNFAIFSGILFLFTLNYAPQVRARLMPSITAEASPLIPSVWQWFAPGVRPPSELAAKVLPGGAQMTLHFGSSGIGPGQFQNATAVAVDASGQIFVAEAESGRIQRFTPDGQFITQWQVSHALPIEQIAVDRQNGLYLLQGGVITRYDATTGSPLSTVTYPALIPLFRDFMLTLDGGLVATRFAGMDEVVRYNAQGEIVANFPHLLGDQLNQVVVNSKVAVDGLDQIYLIGGEFHPTLLKFGPDGKFLDKLADDSPGPGQINPFATLVVDGQGHLFVSAWQGVQIFQANGGYLATIPTDARVTDLALSEQNELLVLTPTQVFKFQLLEQPNG